jgi:hypothetical protein
MRGPAHRFFNTDDLQFEPKSPDQSFDSDGAAAIAPRR